MPYIPYIHTIHRADTFSNHWANFFLTLWGSVLKSLFVVLLVISKYQEDAFHVCTPTNLINYKYKCQWTAQFCTLKNVVANYLPDWFWLHLTSWLTNCFFLWTPKISILIFFLLSQRRFFKNIALTICLIFHQKWWPLWFWRIPNWPPVLSKVPHET